MSNPFSPAHTAKAVHATLEEAYAAIPPGHTKALIISASRSGIDGAGIRGMYVERAADASWGLVFEAGYNGSEGVHGGFKVALSGK
jgi:hypothetical protein